MCEFEDDSVVNDLDERIKHALAFADNYFKESNNCARLALVWIEEANSLVAQREAIV